MPELNDASLASEEMQILNNTPSTHQPINSPTFHDPDAIGESDEWRSWYALSPQSRWRETQKLWEFYQKTGGSLDPEPDYQSPFRDGSGEKQMPGRKETIVRYKRAWEQRERERVRANELRRKRALGEAVRLGRLLAKRYKIDRVILFGSVLDSERFMEDSDIDVAVEGLIPADFFSAIGFLLTESDFAIDLVDRDIAGDLMKSRIEKGRILYEHT